MPKKITFTDNEDGTLTAEVIIDEESLTMVFPLSFDDFILLAPGFTEGNGNREMMDIVEQGTIIPNGVESGFFT